MMRRQRLLELTSVFGTLGFIGFGGPAAHIALMQREVVQRRRWLDDGAFLELVALANLIPGPNSTELAMMVGRHRAGRAGLIVAGLAFMLPAIAIVLGLAWVYVEHGSTPAADALLYGVKPVIVAIVAVALVAFARTALTSVVRVVIAVAVAVLWTLGINELLLLVAAAVGLATVHRAMSGAWAVGVLAPLGATAAATGAGAVNLGVLALVFLKVGALLYGSGYVLLAFLRGDLVERLGWLTDVQLLDAVAIGQVTPGPLFTTATFVGYVLAGVPGALIATVAIFLPGFVFVALLGGIADRIRDRPWAAALLAGLTVAAVGLMAAASALLAQAALTDAFTVALAVASFLVLLTGRVPSVALVLAGGTLGLLVSGFRPGI